MKVPNEFRQTTNEEAGELRNVKRSSHPLYRLAIRWPTQKLFADNAALAEQEPVAPLL